MSFRCFTRFDMRLDVSHATPKWLAAVIFQSSAAGNAGSVGNNGEMKTLFQIITRQ